MYTSALPLRGQERAISGKTYGRRQSLEPRRDSLSKSLAALTVITRVRQILLSISVRVRVITPRYVRVMHRNTARAFRSQKF